MGLTQKDLRSVLVDPSPEAITIASKNLIVNSLSRNVSFYPAFVSNSVGEDVTFYSAGWEAASSMYSSHAKTAASKGEQKKVSTVTVDFLCEYYQLIPDLVKIDVEGAELLVLEGAKDLASKQKAMFFIEMHKLEERTMKESGQFVIDWCKTQKYNPYYLTNHCLLTDSDQIASRGKCHLLLLPESKKYPNELTLIARGSDLKQ
jgi:FkbM family methyltransferase